MTPVSEGFACSLFWGAGSCDFVYNCDGLIFWKVRIVDLDSSGREDLGNQNRVTPQFNSSQRQPNW